MFDRYVQRKIWPSKWKKSGSEEIIICSLSSVAYVRTRHEQRSPSNLKKSGNRRTLFQTSISLFQLNSGGENLVYYHNRRGILVHPEEDLAVKMKKIRERRNNNMFTIWSVCTNTSWAKIASGNRRTLFQTSISLFLLNSGRGNLIKYQNIRGIKVHPEEDYLAVKIKKIR